MGKILNTSVGTEQRPQLGLGIMQLFSNSGEAAVTETRAPLLNVLQVWGRSGNLGTRGSQERQVFGFSAWGTLVQASTLLVTSPASANHIVLRRQGKVFLAPSQRGRTLQPESEPELDSA